MSEDKMLSPVHELPVRVYYEDTDAGGVVYHASYIRYAERGRTEMMRSHGFAHADMLAKTGIGFAVVSLKADYRQPARLDDLLTVKTYIARLGGASMDMRQVIYRNNDVITDLTVTLVCIDPSFKAVRLPQAVRDLAAMPVSA